MTKKKTKTKERQESLVPLIYFGPKIDNSSKMTGGRTEIINDSYKGLRKPYDEQVPIILEYYLFDKKGKKKKKKDC